MKVSDKQIGYFQIRIKILFHNYPKEIIDLIENVLQNTELQIS